MHAVAQHLLQAAGRQFLPIRCCVNEVKFPILLLWKNTYTSACPLPLQDCCAGLWRLTEDLVFPGSTSAGDVNGSSSIPGSGGAPGIGMATHSSILENTRAHYSPWAQEPGRATVMGPQRDMTERVGTHWGQGSRLQEKAVSLHCQGRQLLSIVLLTCYCWGLNCLKFRLQPSITKLALILNVLSLGVSSVKQWINGFTVLLSTRGIDF